MISKLFNQESKSIAGAALIIGGSAVLSRFLGLIRDRLLVSRFTVGDELDAYYASFQIPNLLFALLVLGVLSAAFIPVFTDYLTKGKREEAWRMTNSILSIVMVGMAALCLALSIGAPWLVRLTAHGFEGEKLALTVRLTRIMMLSPFFFAISAVLSSVLNSFKQFMAVSIAPLLYNAAIIFGILFLSVPFGVAGVAYGAIAGAVLHLLIQLPAVSALGWRWRYGVDTRQPGVREVGRLFLPRVFGIDISQISQFVGTSIGTTLGTGAPAIFNLAMNIAAVPIGAIAIPFAIAAFPNLSEEAARGDRGAFIRTFASTFRQILFFLIPLSVLAMVLRLHIVRVIIGSQGLSWHETRLAAAAFGFFVVSLVFQGLVPLLARAFYALKNTLIPVIVSIVSVTVNVSATYAGIWWLDASKGGGNNFLRLPLNLYGVDDVRVLALPLAFSVASVVQVVLLIIILRHRHGRIGGTGLLRAFLKFAVAAALCAVAAIQVLVRTESSIDLTRFKGVFLHATLATTAGLAAYFITLKIMRSEELDSFAGVFRRKMMRVEKPLPVQDAQEM